jgi:hypothetical protein
VGVRVVGCVLGVLVVGR